MEDIENRTRELLARLEKAKRNEAGHWCDARAAVDSACEILPSLIRALRPPSALREGDARKFDGRWMVCTDPDIERFVGFEGQDVPEACALETQWNPISSAPKDGRWIMICRAGHDEVLLSYWHRLHGAWWGQGGTAGTWEKWEKATHWKPLPSPPEVE